jgi:Fe-S-cluster containining protein
MTLTEADIERLERAGHHGVWKVNSEGDLQLRNLRGACVLLFDGRCAAYRDRPDGCRFYPFVLDLEDDRVVRDEHCPWRSEFVAGLDVESQLRRSVATEVEELRRRRAHLRHQRTPRDQS